MAIRGTLSVANVFTDLNIDMVKIEDIDPSLNGLDTYVHEVSYIAVAITVGVYVDSNVASSSSFSSAFCILFYLISIAPFVHFTLSGCPLLCSSCASPFYYSQFYSLLSSFLIPHPFRFLNCHCDTL